MYVTHCKLIFEYDGIPVMTIPMFGASGRSPFAAVYMISLINHMPPEVLVRESIHWVWYLRTSSSDSYMSISKDNGCNFFDKRNTLTPWIKACVTIIGVTPRVTIAKLHC